MDQLLPGTSAPAKSTWSHHTLTSHLLMQVQMQSPIAEARMLAGQLAQPLLNLTVVSSASIPATRSRHCHQLADVALTGLELHQQAPYFRSPRYEPGWEPREFFLITD